MDPGELDSAVRNDGRTIYKLDNNIRLSPWPPSAFSLSPKKLTVPFFDEAHLALLAAEAGQGVVLDEAVLADDALRSDRLWRVLQLDCEAGGYYLITHEGLTGSAAVVAFTDWLESELALCFQARHPPSTVKVSPVM